MDHIQQVARRLRGLRDALDLSVEEIAAECGVSAETFAAYENGEKDISVSFLNCIANRYGVELTVLLFGEEPKMDSHFVTRAGKGVKVERTKAYSYQDIAAGFAHRKMAPFIVTVEPAEDKPVTMNAHDGQEFNYVLDGQMEITVGNTTTVLNEGDSIMFDAQRPHGMKALGDKAVKFIAIIS